MCKYFGNLIARHSSIKFYNLFVDMLGRQTKKLLRMTNIMMENDEYVCEYEFSEETDGKIE